MRHFLLRRSVHPTRRAFQLIGNSAEFLISKKGSAVSAPLFAVSGLVVVLFVLVVLILIVVLVVFVLVVVRVVVSTVVVLVLIIIVIRHIKVLLNGF